MRALLCSLIVLPISLGAETITVRSGLHDDFTRLTIPLPSPDAFKIRDMTDGYEVEVLGSDISYNLNYVFTRIDRGTIQSVSSDRDKLYIQVPETISSRHFVEAGSLLVIDFFVDATPSSAQLPIITRSENGLYYTGSFLEELPHSFPESVRVVPDRFDVEIARGEVVQIDVGEISSRRRTMTFSGPVGISASSDFPFIEAKLLHSSQSESFCTKSELFDFVFEAPESYTGESDVSRFNIYDEFDEINREEVIEYSRALLRIGLYQEAVEVANLVSVDEAADAIRVIAGAVNENKYLNVEADETCADSFRFWSTINSERRVTEADAQRFVPMFRSLPRTLQDDLLQRVVELMIDSDLQKIAESLVIVGDSRSASRLAEANILENAGLFDEAYRILRTGSYSFDRSSMIKLMQVVRENGLEIDEETYELIRSEVFIGGTSVEYVSLRDEFVKLSLVLGKQFELARLYESHALGRDLHNEVQNYLVANSPDSLFLSLVVAGQFSEIDADGLMRISQRVGELGYSLDCLQIDIVISTTCQ